jgi:hypothetical protein
MVLADLVASKPIGSRPATGRRRIGEADVRFCRRIRSGVKPGSVSPASVGPARAPKQQPLSHDSAIL